MSTFSTKNLMNVFVAKDVAGTALASITSDLLTTMADGQVVAVGTPAAGGAEQLIPASAAAGSYSHFRLVEKQGGLLNYGDRIKVSDMILVTDKAYTAPAEQVYFVGYNGTSGSIDVSQANEFILTIAYDHDDMMWSEQKLRNAYDYYSPAPTQQDVALSMASQINYKENLGAINGTGRMVRAEVVSNGTAADWTGAATHIKVTLDSTAVIFTNGSGTAAAGQAFSNGALLNIYGTTYTVSGNGTTAGFTLNMPYQGAGISPGASTAEIAGGTTQATQAGVLTGVTAFGVKVSGQPLTWVKDFFKYNKVKFHFDIKGFGATAYDRPGSISGSSSESSKGVGTAYEVAEFESFAAGFEGALNRMVVPLPAGRTYADTTTPKTYDTIVFEASDTSTSSPIVGTTGMRVQQFVFIPVSAGVKTILGTQLNTLLAAYGASI